MDKETYWESTRFAELYLEKNKPLTIVDIGSFDVNGSARPIFDKPPWQYTGLDITPGPNVDLVATNPYAWPIADNSYDVVFSCSTLEHVEDLYAWADEAVRILKPGGLLCVISPFVWNVHEYPLDCWRFCPSGFRFLFIKRGKLQEIECKIPLYLQDGGLLMDKQCLIIAKKEGAEMLKYGFDMHGVLSHHEWAREMARALLKAGHEVHVVTAVDNEEESRAWVASLGISFTAVHCIHATSHADAGDKKAAVMKEKGIQLLLDDVPDVIAHVRHHGFVGLHVQ